MHFLRQILLDTRFSLTRSMRQRQLQQLADCGQSPMSVLFYHRIADTLPNPWTISCSEFQRQVEYCLENADLISLTELQRRSRLGANHRPTVSLTIDDGYAENCRFAIPLLIRQQIPCTYFVTLDHILTGKPFLHDVRRAQPLPINTIDEIRAMADGGIEIGLHSRTHIDFSRLDSEKQIYDEVIDAAAELADLIRRPIRYFAFPYGLPQHLSNTVIDAIRELGMSGYCSAYGAYNFPGQDPFHIRRFHGDGNFSMFRNWLTYDERKVRQENRRLSQSSNLSLGAVAEVAKTFGDAPPLAKLSASSATPRISCDNAIAVKSSSSHPLRTMFVITSMPVGGAETLLVNLIDRFDPNRIQPEVVCLKEPGPLGEKIAARHKLHSHLLRNKWDIGVLSRLANLMRDRQIDAVITVGAGDKMFWGRLAARRAGVPVICSALHSTGWPDGVGRLNRMLTPLTDGFIACADHHGVHLSKHEGFPIDRVHVIRNGVDCDRFAPDTDARCDIRNELGVSESTKLVGIVAALRPEKNHVMFVNVAKRVCDVRNDVHFVIVGDGPERATIEAAIDKLALRDRMHLLGTRHDTPKIVAALDLFLLCSHNEASPVSILEALACEVPVVSTRVGSVAESVIDGQTGYLVETDDRDSMAARVLTLLDDDLLRDSMGILGRELVHRTGSLDSMVAGYTNLIESIYRQKRGIDSRQMSRKMSAMRQHAQDEFKPQSTLGSGT